MIRKHPYTAALIYFKKIFHFLTFQTSKLPKTVAKKTKNMTSFPCSVRSADFLPYAHCTLHIFLDHTYILISVLHTHTHCSFLPNITQGPWAQVVWQLHNCILHICIIYFFRAHILHTTANLPNITQGAWAQVVWQLLAGSWCWVTLCHTFYH